MVEKKSNKNLFIYTFAFVIIVLFLVNFYYTHVLSEIDENNKNQFKKILTSTKTIQPIKKETKIIKRTNSDLENIKLKIKEQQKLIKEKINNKKKSSSSKIEPKAKEIKEAFLFAWNNYKQFAWGSDELMPISKKGKDTLNVGLTIIENLDTLFIMNELEKFNEAKKFVEKLEFKFDDFVSASDLNTKVLGGLISAFSLSGEKIFIEKAVELADILMLTWISNSTLPMPEINTKTKDTQFHGWTREQVILSEAGSYTLEFCTLSVITGDSNYCQRAVDVVDFIQKNANDGMIQTRIDYNTFETNERITFGKEGDSYYESLLKIWILSGKQVKRFREYYDNAIETAYDRIVAISTPNKMTYLKMGLHLEMDHVSCSAAGMWALGANGNRYKKDIKTAKDIMHTCFAFFDRHKTKLAPYSVVFINEWTDFYLDNYHYYLRPESLESLFYLYRTTKDPIYREMGGKIFDAIVTNCKSSFGFHGIDHVDVQNSGKRNLQDSYFLSETLKYLYLLFSDESDMDISEWVFNSSGHPFQVWKKDSFESMF